MYLCLYVENAIVSWKRTIKMTLKMKDTQKCDIFIDTQTPRQFQDHSVSEDITFRN